jgi:hypothetical protein
VSGLKRRAGRRFMARLCSKGLTGRCLVECAE